MRNYLILIISTGLLFLSSCTKVNNLSDEAGIVDFRITKISEGVDLNTNNLVVTDKSVSIPLEFGRKNFPLKITTEIKFSKTTDDVISVDERPLNLQEITFTDVYTPQTFFMISDSGIPHEGRIMLVDKKNAEIEQFKIKGADDKDISVLIRDNNVRIIFKQGVSWPLQITPEIIKTPSADYKDYTVVTPMTFQIPGDVKQLTLIADNGDERLWNIQIVPSIENSDFELWINEGTSSINIDPIPGKGYGWATANNPFVQGTRPVASYRTEYGKAAEMKTSIQNLDGLGIGNLITAGTIFTGYFKMNVSQLNDPPAMTYFGIPFINRPSSISVDAKYEPGTQLQQSVKEGKYKLKDLSGFDKGRIWVKLLYWKGEGNIDFHDKDTEDVITLGMGEYIFDGADPSVQNWTKLKIPIIYNKAYTYLEPTHISIVMTSSEKGDYFIGAEGSKLTVDNLTINY